MPADVLVIGAGLAGLAAARELEDRGLAATIAEARDRVGGRIWTCRDGFAEGQHAEGGADIIESEQEGVRALVRRFPGLRLAPILSRGFGYYGPDRTGRVRRQSMGAGARDILEPLNALIRDYKLAEQRWDGPVAARLGSRSVADWIRSIARRKGSPGARYLLSRFRGFRGLFLADPEDLSLLALVDFFAGDPFGGDGGMARVAGGNDRLTTALAASLTRKPMLRSVLRRLRQSSRDIEAAIDGPSGLATLRADYAIVTIPPPLLRNVVFDPPLRERQRDAFRRARMGPATRVLLQFKSRFWNRRRQPSLFGSDRATGAVWDGNEEQRGRAGILSLLAGGGASRELQDLMARGGQREITRRLAWLGRPSALMAVRAIAWESDRWSGGGYVAFGPDFDPSLREWLARPHGRVFFAGEHTSMRWQGYMNGAVESGQRAAIEVIMSSQGAKAIDR